MAQAFEGKLEARGLKFAIVQARFNHFIADRLLEGAIDALARGPMDDDESWPDHVFPMLGAQWYLGLTVPEAYGGQGLGLRAAGLVSEVMHKWNPALGPSWAAHDTGPAARRTRPIERLRNARTTSGSKWVPAHRASSARASSGETGSLYDRVEVSTS